MIAGAAYLVRLLFNAVWSAGNVFRSMGGWIRLAAGGLMSIIRLIPSFLRNFSLLIAFFPLAIGGFGALLLPIMAVKAVIVILIAAIAALLGWFLLTNWKLSNLKATFTGTWDAIKTATLNAINSMIRGMNLLIDGINLVLRAFKKLSSFRINVGFETKENPRSDHQNPDGFRRFPIYRRGCFPIPSYQTTHRTT